MARPLREGIRYKRSRFSTRLPEDRLYTESHFWLKEQEAGVWTVGFTKFATRMLGDLVEHGFEVGPGEEVTVGQRIGWVEGFKAVSDLYCVVAGEFLDGNRALDEDVTLLDTDPYGEGWLYRVRGTPEPARVDVHGYTSLLDRTIDRMQQSEIGGGEANDE